MLAYSGSTWTQVIVAFSIFVPVTIAVAITVKVLRGAKDDPDEQRWRRQAEERRLRSAEVVDGAEVGDRVDVGK